MAQVVLQLTHHSASGRIIKVLAPHAEALYAYMAQWAGVSTAVGT